MDTLDNEASEDEAARKSGPLDRLPSHEANMKLVEKQKRYRHLLVTAGESDELVRQKWDEWEQNIVALTWSEVRWSSFIFPMLSLAGRFGSIRAGIDVQCLVTAYAGG